MIYDNSKIRRQDRLLDEQRAREILTKAEYGVLSMVDNQGNAYGIAVNFAFDEENSFYIHCAKEGRKTECLVYHPQCTFTIVGNTSLIADKFTTNYESVILECTANLGLTDEQKLQGHDFIIKKYCPEFIEKGREYVQKSFHRMDIIRFDISSFSGKAKLVVQSQTQEQQQDTFPSTPFECWDLDLLVDYVLKIHHRGIRHEGKQLLKMIDHVCGHHGNDFPYLLKVRELFAASFEALDNHCKKEDNMLYPYIYDLYNVYVNKEKIQPFHCGTIQQPINVMMNEHSQELERHKEIEHLTNNYTAPKNACRHHRMVIQWLKRFKEVFLLEHIHIENDILFPMALEIEKENVQA